MAAAWARRSRGCGLWTHGRTAPREPREPSGTAASVFRAQQEMGDGGNHPFCAQPCKWGEGWAGHQEGLPQSLRASARPAQPGSLPGSSFFVCCFAFSQNALSWSYRPLCSAILEVCSSFPSAEKERGFLGKLFPSPTNNSNINA